MTSFTIQLADRGNDRDYWTTEIVVWKTDVPGVRVFGADAIWQWDLCSCKDNPSRDHIRNHAQNINRGEWLHNILSETNQKLLRGHFVLSIVSGDEEYEKVSRLWDMHSMSDAEIFEMCGGIL